MKKIIYLLVAVTFTVVATSCKKTQDPGGTAVQSLANEWWVVIDNDNDAAGDFAPGYYKLSTYNTSSNSSTQMWFDDNKSFWELKGKVNINLADQTFSGTNIANQYYASTFSITNGKIITNGAHAPGSKAVTDSISFNMTLSDDNVPGTVHKVTGYARTRFPEDDH